VSTTLRDTKQDLPYIDVLSESINNPLRFCLGWYMVTASLLPAMSLLLSYWMLGRVLHDTEAVQRVSPD